MIEVKANSLETIGKSAKKIWTSPKLVKLVPGTLPYERACSAFELTAGKV